MLAEMPCSQYMEWQHFDQIEPLDGAAVIALGLTGSADKSGGKSTSRLSSGGNWQSQLQFMRFFGEMQNARAQREVKGGKNAG